MRYAIGIDLGGSKMEGVLLNEKGKVLKKHRFPVPYTKNPSVLIDLLADIVKELSIKPILGVGISHPGYVDNKGILRDAPNLPSINNKSFPKLLKAKVKKKLFFENDANCFLLAEHKWGAAKGAKHVAGIIVGTGIGGGLILNEELYKGANNGVEIGHIKFLFETFDIEHLVSGPNISRRYKILSGLDKDAKEIFASKDVEAKKIQKESVEILAWLCGVLINTFNPEVIVFGGGVSNAKIYSELKLQTKKYALPSNIASCKIKKNSLGDSSGSLGAATLFF